MLVSTNRAMREPNTVERATGTGFTLFYILNGTIMCRMRPVAHIKTFKHYETCEEFLSEERPPHDDNGHEYGIRFV